MDETCSVCTIRPEASFGLVTGRGVHAGHQYCRQRKVVEPVTLNLEPRSVVVQPRWDVKLAQKTEQAWKQAPKLQVVCVPEAAESVVPLGGHSDVGPKAVTAMAPDDHGYLQSAHAMAKSADRLPDVSGTPEAVVRWCAAVPSVCSAPER